MSILPPRDVHAPICLLEYIPSCLHKDFTAEFTLKRHKNWLIFISFFTILTYSTNKLQRCRFTENMLLLPPLLKKLLLCTCTNWIGISICHSFLPFHFTWHFALNRNRDLSNSFHSISIFPTNSFVSPIAHRAL